MPTSPDETPKKFTYNVALTRLFYVALVGCLFVVIYAASYSRESVAQFFGAMSVGLMTGGAALVVGGLLGFLFGVPHSREAESAQPPREPRPGSGQDQDAGSKLKPATNYRPNTSLEQISDWLTKILVGVGLVQIKSIGPTLTSMARYVAGGLASGAQNPPGPAEAFAFGTIIYFSVSGFVFGFLWSRLYLRRWFQEADVEELGAKVSMLERQLKADADALATITRHLNPQPDEPAASEPEVATAIKQASPPVRAQIFDMAQRASESERNADDYDVKVRAAIDVFKGLIASDINRRYHRNHSELSYALSRTTPPDWGAAITAITEAMNRRDQLGKKGWKYYELRRARCRVKLDPKFQANQPSDGATKAEVIKDLQVARGDTAKWDKWYSKEADINNWAILTKVDVESLLSSAAQAGR